VTDDTRIVTDIVVGGLLGRWLGAALQLIALKAFIEPAAVWAGRSPYRWLDRLLGGVLPGGPGGHSALLKHPDVDGPLADQGQHLVPQVDVVDAHASQGGM